MSPLNLPITFAVRSSRLILFVVAFVLCNMIACFLSSALHPPHFRASHTIIHAHVDSPKAVPRDVVELPMRKAWIWPATFPRNALTSRAVSSLTPVGGKEDALNPHSESCLLPERAQWTWPAHFPRPSKEAEAPNSVQRDEHKESERSAEPQKKVKRHQLGFNRKRMPRVLTQSSDVIMMQMIGEF